MNKFKGATPEDLSPALFFSKKSDDTEFHYEFLIASCPISGTLPGSNSVAYFGGDPRGGWTGMDITNAYRKFSAKIKIFLIKIWIKSVKDIEHKTIWRKKQFQQSKKQMKWKFISKSFPNFPITSLQSPKKTVSPSKEVTEVGGTLNSMIWVIWKVKQRQQHRSACLANILLLFSIATFPWPAEKCETLNN